MERAKELASGTLAEQREAAKIIAQIAAKYDKMNRTAGEVAVQTENAMKYQQEMSKLVGDITDRLDSDADIRAQATANLREQLEVQQEILKTQIAIGQANSEDAGTAKAKIKELSEQLKAASQQEAAMGRIRDQSQETIAALTGVSDSWSKGLVGSIITAEGGLKQFAASAKEVLTVDNIMGSIMEKMIESTIGSAIAYDNASSSMKKATGQGDLYNDTLKSAMLDGNASMRTWEQMGSAVTALNDGFSQFNLIASQDPGLAQRMTQTVATLEGLGASSSVVVDNMESLTRTFGYSEEESRGLTIQMADMGLQLGMTADEVMQGFTAAAPRMALFGKEGVRVFSELQMFAQSTGVSMETMLGMTEQFDTFEGAGQAVGKLNAMLGTNLNMMDMMMMSDEERVEAIVGAVEAGELQWGQMNRFQKQAVAQAAGINDMAEAERMFANGRAGLRAYNLEKRTQAEAESLLEQRAASSLTIAEQQAAMMQQMAGDVSYLVDEIKALQTSINEWMTENRGLVVTIASVATGLWLAWKAVSAYLAISKAWEAFQATKLYTAMGNGLARVQLYTEALWNGIKAGAAKVLNLGKQAGAWAIQKGAIALSTIATWAQTAAVWALNSGLLVVAATVAAAFAAFFIVKEVTEYLWDMSPPLAILVGLLLAVAAAAGAFWIASTLGVGSAPIIAGIVGLAAVMGVAAAAVGKLQEAELGMTNSPGGATLVGEGGPEIVTMPRGGNVITNENLDLLGNMVEERLTLEAEIQSGIGGFSTLADNLSSGAQSSSGPTTVILQIKERELGKAVIDILNSRPELSTVVR